MIFKKISETRACSHLVKANMNDRETNLSILAGAGFLSLDASSGLLVPLHVEYVDRRIQYGILFIISLFYEYSKP